MYEMCGYKTYSTTLCNVTNFHTKRFFFRGVVFLFESGTELFFYVFVIYLSVCVCFKVVNSYIN